MNAQKTVESIRSELELSMKVEGQLGEIVAVGPNGVFGPSGLQIV